jgi:hypothetical protein
MYIRTVLVCALVFALSASTALAHHDEGGNKAFFGLFRGHGSTTANVKYENASSTRPMGPKEDTQLSNLGGVQGKVGTVGINSFTLTRPGNKEMATSTFTVQVSNTTQFSKGSTTAAFADVAVNARVVVFGRMATSTKTITAERVLLVGEIQQPLPIKEKKPFFPRLKELLFGAKGEHGTRESMNHDTPAAVVASDVALSTALKGIVSWF